MVTLLIAKEYCTSSWMCGACMSLNNTDVWGLFSGIENTTLICIVDIRWKIVKLGWFIHGAGYWGAWLCTIVHLSTQHFVLCPSTSTYITELWTKQSSVHSLSNTAPCDLPVIEHVLQGIQHSLWSTLLLTDKIHMRWDNSCNNIFPVELYTSLLVPKVSFPFSLIDLTKDIE